jgi:hypothetical protein
VYTLLQHILTRACTCNHIYRWINKDDLSWFERGGVGKWHAHVRTRKRTRSDFLHDPCVYYYIRFRDVCNERVRTIHRSRCGTHVLSCILLHFVKFAGRKWTARASSFSAQFISLVTHLGCFSQSPSITLLANYSETRLVTSSRSSANTFFPCSFRYVSQDLTFITHIFTIYSVIYYFY